jgi:phenylpropionate dioxygenase-like ring-hydroxylating dioxygenase large terminal subunit
VVHVPTRGDLPARLGPTVQQIPDYGPSVLARDAYSDPIRFELERERVLGTHWMVAGRSSQCPNPGDWITYEGHGETVVITRQPGGGLSAFHNVCQHRGPALVTELHGCGARRFTCPYHGWVYDTTGKLLGVPEREDFSADHLRDVRAPVVAAEEWAGWIWINLLGAAAPSLINTIGPDIVSDLGRFKMEDMVLHEVLEWDVPVSYKAIVDGFNEVYHVAELHQSDPAFVKSVRDTSFHIMGDNYMCFVPRQNTYDRTDPHYDHHQHAICHYVVFPNAVFNCNPTDLQLFTPVPIDVDRTKFLCWELIYDGDKNDPEYAAYYDRAMKHWDTLKGVVGEDIAIYDQLARTKRSSGYRQNILSERECKIAHYHENMDRKIRS